MTDRMIPSEYDLWQHQPETREDPVLGPHLNTGTDRTSREQRFANWRQNIDYSLVQAVGLELGMAFQIADDVLDVTATTDQLGKTAGRDRALHKSTYPAVLGLAGAVERANGLTEEACSALERAGMLTAELEYLARFSVSRRH